MHYIYYKIEKDLNANVERQRIYLKNLQKQTKTLFS